MLRSFVVPFLEHWMNFFSLFDCWASIINSWPDCVATSRNIVRYSVQEENAGSLDSKIDVFPLELHA